MDPSTVLGQLLKPGEDPQVLNERLQELQGFFRTVLYPDKVPDTPNVPLCAPASSAAAASRARCVIPARPGSTFVEKPLAGTCPRGHDLVLTRIPYVGRCDGCIKRLEVTTDIMRCEVCEYDLCLRCKLNGIKLPASAFIPAGAAPFTPSSFGSGEIGAAITPGAARASEQLPLFDASAVMSHAPAKRSLVDHVSPSKKMRSDITEASERTSSITPPKEHASSESTSSTRGPSGHSLSSPTNDSLTTGASLQLTTLDHVNEEDIQSAALPRDCALMEQKAEISKTMADDKTTTEELPGNPGEQPLDAAVTQPKLPPVKTVAK